MISQMFINVNVIVIILLNIFKKIKNDALDNGNIISLKKKQDNIQNNFFKIFY